MFSQGHELDRFFSPFGTTAHPLSELFEELFGEAVESRSQVTPRFSLQETPTSFSLTASLPGMSEKDLHIDLHQSILTVSGERNTTPPEGYSVLRRERPTLRFTRSVALPARVDPEKVSATLKNGVLTIQLEKAQEAQRRAIAVKAG